MRQRDNSLVINARRKRSKMLSSVDKDQGWIIMNLVDVENFFKKSQALFLRCNNYGSFQVRFFVN